MVAEFTAAGNKRTYAQLVLSSSDEDESDDDDDSSHSSESAREDEAVFQRYLTAARRQAAANRHVRLRRPGPPLRLQQHRNNMDTIVNLRFTIKPRSAQRGGLHPPATGNYEGLTLMEIESIMHSLMNEIDDRHEEGDDSYLTSDSDSDDSVDSDVFIGDSDDEGKDGV